MHDTNTTDALGAFDLNLLRTLSVVLEEGSVTRAARRLGRSQPAVSHALGRLRDALGDPLLVREGARLVPTRRARALRDPLDRVLADLRRVLSAEPEFDPARATRHFVLACPSALAPLLPEVLQSLSDAPGVTLELRNTRGEAALLHADLVLDALPDEAPGVRARRLGSLTQVVAMRADHPARASWGLDAWIRWPHLMIRTGTATPSPIASALAARGHQRQVGLVVPDLLLAPHVVARTDLLFTGASALLAPLAKPLGLALMPLPIEVPSATAAAMWRERHTADAGHRWFRDRVVDVLTRRLEAS